MPNITALAAVKLVPVMVTVVPPPVDPAVGVNEVMVGGGTNLKFPVDVAVPPTVVTEILTVAAEWGFVLALIVVAFVTVYVAAVVVPNLTALAPVKLVPVTVTVVLPLAGPDVGVKEAMVGAATNL